MHVNTVDFTVLHDSHAIPSGEEWSQSESRWEVRPGVQVLHLSSVIKTGTPGPSQTAERKMEKDGERGSTGSGSAPAQLGDLWSVTHAIPLSHFYLSLKCTVTHFSLQLSTTWNPQHVHCSTSHQMQFGQRCSSLFSSRCSVATRWF